MKSFAVVFVISAMLVVVGLAAANRSRSALPGDVAAAPRSDAEGERYAMSVGRPVELTQGEAQDLRTIAPGIDPAMVPPQKVGKIRAILYGPGNTANKRSRIESLLN
ncbi:hypothetical protein [Salipiger mangrovisoli]|uniref:Uncharacterized protein n=1 Tax=Salipiger mangrovisoli TaxID=2865933 RepID=A0ABR9X3N9_9RHOB|nr:hypothetical protein [Salipiger mangrovisoli]MBE9638205.1 hypothetical protein [Salipiger mangrovisoli]